MKILLERLETSDQGTFGRLMLPGRMLYTGELPWRSNSPNISCIPPGKYMAKWTWSARFGRRMYEIGPVRGRAGVRIHSANLMGSVESGLRSQLSGCIALGEHVGRMGKQKALLVSRPAVAEFERTMAGRAFELEIADVFTR